MAMSEAGVHRRQPPSPLVFAPDTVLSPIPLQAQSSNSSSHGSGSNTVSMPFVRRHVTRRLKAAKAECDKELQRVTNNVTAFFEERLREGDQEIERDHRERGADKDHDSQLGDHEHLREPFVFHTAELGAPLQLDEYSSDGGYEAETEYSRHSRQPSVQMSPGALRRQSTAPWEKPVSSSVSSSAIGSSPASSTVLLPETSISRKQNIPAPSPTSWPASGASSRRLSRSVHIPTRPTPSGQSSRSTSRSRSPLPPTSSHASFSEYALATFNRRSSRFFVDDPVDPLMAALYELIAVATDVTDMPVAQLMNTPKICETIVQRVQNIGKAWDDHSDWPGRNWYVQVLLAVASLSRVVEWWEAEKQFWNFDDNNDEQDEPLMFVMKPADEDVPNLDLELESFRLDDKPPSPNFSRKEKEELTSLAPSTDDEMASTPSRLTPNRTVSNAESARVLATERLRLQAETAQNQNIVMELSLDGDHFIWVNYAWRVVVGTDPDSLSGTRISSLLAPSDWGVFKEATNRLQEDDSHTVEVRFKLQTEPTVQRDPSAGVLYQLMEGKGMLMIDREDGQPSHTMWVVRPIAPARFEHDTISINLEADDLAPEPASTIKQSFVDRNLAVPATPFPFSEPIVTDTILCRICESQIPQWYFEKHSETCAETHRLEAEIMECNESISELRNAIRDLGVAIDRSSPSVAPEYRGMSVFIPSSSPLMSSPLQLFRANKLQRFSVKKMQRRFLDQVDDILQVCLEISMPSLKEEEAKEPIERQRLLSPTSERKTTQVRNWAKPTTEDAALGQLLQDAERVMRQKIDNVVRMQNTIRYAEKIWTEWEERIESYLATINESDSDRESSESENPPVTRRERHDSEATIDDLSSTTSEYNFGRELAPKQPIPMSYLSPIPFLVSPTDVRQITASPTSPPSSYNNSVPLAIPPSNITTLGARQQQLVTRSSTPSSVSSPLARAPIVAATFPDESPPISLDSGPTSSGTLAIKTRKSAQSLLEPKFVVTPPASPQVVGREAPVGTGLTRESSTRRGHRRHSNANALTSPPPTGPLSPRQSTGIPLPRANPTSIKDFEIIKPISKGAFGSVFLAKKKVTGDYYAIKVLKKADMIAKNQITNVKAERMILMKQAESPFVAKLYFTFQSKENLYLVMEYLNGGDCAALIKSLGCLPEEWTKNYVAEVVLGLEYLHQRGIVHRDLKPDNLLIDQHGHLKLTDFGLSRIGLLGRQTRDTQFGRALGRYGARSRPPSMDSAYFSSPLVFSDPSGGSYFTQRPSSVSRISGSPYLPPADDVSESSGSESLASFHARRSGKMTDSPIQSFATELTTDLRSHSNSNASGTTPPGEQKFVGTPDYLAPETILGLRGDDAAVDWWALGVITYEFLYGIPPFHADNPEKVFENILSGHVEWHEDWVEFSQEARDFMQALMNVDTNARLGSRGADQVKAHPWFEGIDWDKVTTTEAAFIPQVTDPESTDYFDPRGAIPQLFHDDEDLVALTSRSNTGSPANMPPPSAPVPIAGKETPNSASSDDFGSFSFKNLPVLKQANDDVIRKLKTDQMAPMTHALSEPANYHQRKRSMSQRIKKPPNVVTNMDPKLMATNPPSPATSTSSIASSPSRTSLPPSTPGVNVSAGNHSRKPSEYGAVERFKLNYLEGDRRNSMPSRLRTASVSSVGDGSGSETWNSSTGGGSQQESFTPPSSVHSIDLRKGPDLSDRVVTCLLAEDNPITAKIIETLLVRLGCRCVVVSDGSEAISVAMGDIKFDCILMDLQMPVLDGEGAARYIKSTNGKNTNTPIIAVSAYSGIDPNETSNVFDASLSKPLQKADLLNVFRQLGFKTTAKQGISNAKVVTAMS